jgi:hypothetical protein
MLTVFLPNDPEVRCNDCGHDGTYAEFLPKVDKPTGEEEAKDPS